MASNPQKAFVEKQDTKPITISYTNNKGGVGKTTVVLNTAAALARKDYTVLVIDNDPQANLTFGLGLRDFTETIYTSVKENTPLPFYKTSIANLFITPCEIKYSELENFYSSQPFGSGYTILSKKIDQLLTKKQHFDFVLIDNAPAIGSFMYNSILATDYTIVVVEGSSFAAKGLEVVVDLLNNFKEQTNNELLGIVINKMNNYVVRKDTAKWLRENYNEASEKLIFDSTISQYVAIEEAAALQQSIFHYTQNNEGVNPAAQKEFEALTEELVQLLQSKKIILTTNP